ncbi:MAG: 6-bladed beta-propeller [Rubrivivax sp.]|nr:6-bladed beta-propeller [Rubrivivax sp.]
MRRAAAAWTLAMLAILAAGCATPPARPPLPVMIWPLPPEVPRISLDNVIAGPQDLGLEESAWQGLMRFLAGRTPTPLVNPNGLVADSQGRLYVLDAFSRQVHVFDTVAGRHRLWVGEGAGFVSPVGITLDEQRGRLYVSDSAQGHVQILSLQSGEPLGVIRSGGLERPTGVAVNPVTDELLVADTLNATIVRYALEDHAVKGLIGKEGTASGHFHAPTHLAVARTGEIVVTDALNFRVQVFSAQGQFLRSFGAPGDSPGYFSRPKGVAVDSDGNIYVVDALFDNVQIFSAQGELLMSFGSPGGEPGEFWLPSGIFIDTQDRVHIADSYNKRVQVFRYLKNAEVSP